jgi:hypothetical protein
MLFFGMAALMRDSDLVRRIHEFANRKGLTLGDQLGAGVQGIVFSAKSQSEEGRFAIKIHKHEPGYLRERDAYLRLQEQGITTIRGCNVPELIAHDDASWIIEMTAVSRPFVLDFGGAYLDAPPDFSEEVLADWHAEKVEQFGPRWPEAQSILRELESFGIFVVDVNPGNISFGPSPREI